jgi:hypothetical protein
MEPPSPSSSRPHEPPWKRALIEQRPVLLQPIDMNKDTVGKLAGALSRLLSVEMGPFSYDFHRIFAWICLPSFSNPFPTNSFT